MEATAVGRVRVKITGGTIDHKESGARVVLSDAQSRCIVGRAPSCQLRVDDRHVSATHCELTATERGVLVRDLGSTNGTRINEVLLGAGGQALVTRPATIYVGSATLLFVPQMGPSRELTDSFGPYVTRSPVMRPILEAMNHVAAMRGSVYITGETGTGKGYFAWLIHNLSERASKPFVIVDCPAIPPTLVEGELFGYAKGAFSGAVTSKESPFVEADGGTVFLDEVADLLLDVQARLLRVVDEQMVKAIGQNRYRKVNVRIVSATKHDLAARVNAGLFRDDLYARLTATRIELPPLRERPEDIGPLIHSVLVDLGRPDVFAQIPKDRLDWLRQRPWTGNVRQLKQVTTNIVDLLQRHGASDMAKIVDMAYSLGPGEALNRRESGHARSFYEMLTTRGTSHKAVMDHAARVLFENLHRETGGNVSEIARRADVTRDFAREQLAKLGLRKIQPPHGKKGGGQ